MDNLLDSCFDKLDEINYSKDDILENCCDKDINYVLSDGVIICNICKNTINNVIDLPEWKNYKNVNGNNSTRCGMPSNVLLPDSSLGTIISKNNNDNMNKLNMYQNWNSMPYKERSLYKVFTDMESKCKKHNLPLKIIETSKTLYCIISSTKISRGSNRIGIIAACVFYGCKECNAPRSTKEIANIFDIDIKVMTKGCKNFTEILRLNKNNKHRMKNHNNINVDDFVDRFCSKLSLSNIDIINIYKISKIVDDLKLNNDNTPPSIASGCILLYITYKGLDIDKKKISDVCKISEVTISKCYKKLEMNESINNLLRKL
jgi:transcription initiation factor TFIIIB Brf1 subunit/transcription initiation factor TFIIB